jgi:signal transduction histidine kinase
MLFMRENVVKYFLGSYNFDNEFEQRKAESLLYITLALGLFFFILGIAQKGAQMGNITLLGNVAGLLGVLLTLSFIKKGQLEWAGDMLVIICFGVICIAHLYDDWVSEKQQSQYKLYVSLVSLLGTYILCLSFFRDRLKFYLYAFIGAIIITIHAAIIYYHPLHTEFIRKSITIHYSIAIAGIVLSIVIFNFIIASTEQLLEQNIKISKQLQLQNEDLERTIAARTKSLQASNQNLQEFAYVVSHDLKEPLRTISGFVSIIERRLKKKEQLEPELLEYIQLVINGTKQMDVLIQDLLAYSRLNITEHRFTKIDLNIVLKEVMENLSAAVSETKAIIEIAHLPEVYSDRSLMFQLFQNLLSNAIKYRRPNVPPEVKVGFEEGDSEWKFAVKDNGLGIPKEYYYTVFQAFKRLHNKSDYEGSGVGLAICKKIIELHNSKIWIESAVNEGTTFFFTLPKKQSA